MTFDIQALANGQAVRTVQRHAPALLTVLLVVLLGWQSAGLVWRVVEASLFEPSLPPAADVGPGGNDKGARVPMSRIASLHLFGQAEAQATPEIAANVDAPETRLNLKLRGILSANQPEYSRAIIASGNNEDIYAVGAGVPGGATVHAVLDDRVLLNRRGKIEALTLPKQSAEFTVEDADNDFNAAPAEDFGDIRDQIAEEPAALSEMVRMRPVMEGGQMRGVKIWPLKDRERFAAAGLQPGDLVTAVNGSPLTDPAAMQQVVQQLDSMNTLTLTIERNGSTEEITLNASQ